MNGHFIETLIRTVDDDAALRMNTNASLSYRLLSRSMDSMSSVRTALGDTDDDDDKSDNNNNNNDSNSNTELVDDDDSDVIATTTIDAKSSIDESSSRDDTPSSMHSAPSPSNADDARDVDAEVVISHQAADDALLLQRIFNVRAGDVVRTFTAHYLDVSLLPARLLLTPTMLFVFASLESAVDEQHSGYLQMKEQPLLPFHTVRRWCVLEPHDALVVYRDASPGEAFKPLQRLPLRRIVRVQLAHPSRVDDDKGDGNDKRAAANSAGGDDNEQVSTRFVVTLREPDETFSFMADTRALAHEWLVALRVATAAAHRRTVKRGVPLVSVTSVHSPPHDVVFGAGCITMTIGGGSHAERLWLSSVSDFQETFAALTTAWLRQVHLERMASPSTKRPSLSAAEAVAAGAALPAPTTRAPAPPSAHARQQRFEAAFKLGANELLRDSFSVGLVVNDYGLVARARIYLSENYFCVRSNSMFKKLLAVVPWAAVTQIDDVAFLHVDVGFNVFVRGAHQLSFVLPTTMVAEVRHKVRALWGAARVCNAPYDDDDLVFSVEDERPSSSAGSSALDSSASSASVSASSASASATPQQQMTSAAYFYTARNKTFHECFGVDIPIDETLLQLYTCSLLRSDAKHSGELHVTQHFFAFASQDGMKVVMPRHAVESALPGRRGVVLVCADGSEFSFQDFSRVSSFLKFIQGEDSADNNNNNDNNNNSASEAAAAPSSSSLSAGDGGGDVHFYHAALDAFRSTFGLSDELLDTHACSLVRSLTLPLLGTMYVSKQHVCFEGTLVSSKIVVPFRELLDVQREKHAYMFRDALRLTTASGSFLFVGFWALKRTVEQLQTLCRANREPALVDSSDATVRPPPPLSEASDGARRGSRTRFHTAESIVHELGDDEDDDFDDNDNSNNDIDNRGKPSYSDPERVPVFDESKEHDDEAERALAAKLVSHESPLERMRQPPKPLRIVILTIGSRGDVQPTLALGASLKADGHDVTIGTHAEFKQFVEQRGLTHATLAGDPKALMNLCVSNGMFTPAFVRTALHDFRAFIDELLRSAFVVVKEARAELIMQAPSVFAGAHIAEALNIPLINWFTMPHTPTSRFPHPFAVSQVALGGAYNFLSYAAVHQALWQPLAGQLNQFREELGLAPLSRFEGPAINDNVPIIYCFSRHLCAKPADWPSSAHIAGFFFDDDTTHSGSAAHYKPPQELADFLAAGEPPIYVGFGSITGINDVDAFFDKVVSAIDESKQRCILLTGWAGLGHGKKLPERILVLESVPHDWLFPQCAAVVHHGGAGTLAAGLRAGCPTVVVAFFADQFFWATRVVELGVGRAMHAADLHRRKLRDAIVDAATNPKIKARAQAVGKQIAAEGGVANAKKIIYQVLDKGKAERLLVSH